MAKKPPPKPNYGLPKIPFGTGQQIMNSIEAGADAMNANPGTQYMGPWGGSQSNNGGGPGGGGGPGVNYDQLASMYRAQGAAEAAGMRDSIRQMLIGMGMVPGGFNDKFGALDDATRALISKNTDTGISTLARLNEQKARGITDTVNQLHARGLGRSGAKGFRLRKNQLAYDRNLNDVMSQLMQQVGGMYSTYSNNEYARQAALIMAAMNSWSGGGGSSWMPGQTTNTANNTTSSGSGNTPSFSGNYYYEMGDAYPIYNSPNGGLQMF